MKRIILIAVLALAAAFSASAQYENAPRYKDLKNDYNFRQYEKSEIDPYRVGWADAFSFFVPGSSQLVMGEWRRGLCFFAASGICSSIASNSAEDLLKLVTTDSEGNLAFTDEAKAFKCLKTMLIAGLAELGVAIWSSVDAGRVAKVKNMYYQDLYGRQASVKVNVEPFLSYTPSTVSGNVQPAAGLSMKLSF